MPKVLREGADYREVQNDDGSRTFTNINTGETYIDTGSGYTLQPMAPAPASTPAPAAPVTPVETSVPASASVEYTPTAPIAPSSAPPVTVSPTPVAGTPAPTPAPVPAPTAPAQAPALAAPNYQQYIDYFKTPEAYAAEITAKQSRGQALDDPQAAALFRQDYPQLFATAPIATAQPQPAVPASVPALAQPKNEHQQWLDRTYPGGTAAYIQVQQQRYDQAVMGGDYDLQQRLQADSQRVGYALANPYASQLNRTIQQLEQALGTPFNPADSPMYQSMITAANQIADDQVRIAMEQLNARGILNSTIAGDRAIQIRQQVMAQMLPAILEKTYNIRQDELANLFKMVGFYQENEAAGYERMQKAQAVAREQELQRQKDEVAAEQKRWDRAMARLEEQGYVDNEIQMITGLPLNMPSKSAREKMQQYLFDLDKKQMEIDSEMVKLEYQRGTSLELANINNQASMARAQASRATSIELANINNRASMARAQLSKALTPLEQLKYRAITEPGFMESLSPEQQKAIGAYVEPEKADTLGAMKEALVLKILENGPDSLTDNERAVAPSVGVRLTEPEDELSDLATNEALAMLSTMSNKDRVALLRDLERMAALADEGVNVDRLWNLHSKLIEIKK